MSHIQGYSSVMPEARTERGTCRFVAPEGQGGKPVIRVELFHGTVSVLTHATLNFNLLGGMSLEEAKRMAETINDSVLDLSVTLSSDHPMFAKSAK
ncbi:MAG TPA: hypothetical protein VN833_18150 [Candidatus Acidoferrales bacterium]|nr:hypothetical protein [Candidatus Acidoferrales bacterium]